MRSLWLLYVNALYKGHVWAEAVSKSLLKYAVIYLYTSYAGRERECKQLCKAHNNYWNYNNFLLGQTDMHQE